MYETKRLFLKHPAFSDWAPMLRNVWCHEETARHMLWSVTTTEAAAQERMKRTLEYQKDNPAWLVYQKETGQPIGFAGFCSIGPGVVEDTGVALGPAYVGRGYGKELLSLLLEIAKTEYGARLFVGSCRSQNIPSRALMLACGFRFTHTEDRTDPRNGTAYVVEFYEKNL